MVETGKIQSSQNYIKTVRRDSKKEEKEKEQSQKRREQQRESRRIIDELV